MKSSSHLPGTASRVSTLAASIKDDVTRLNHDLSRLEGLAKAQQDSAHSSTVFGSTPAQGGAPGEEEASHGVVIVDNLKHSLLDATTGLQRLLTNHTSSLNSVSERRGRIGVVSTVVAPALPPRERVVTASASSAASSSLDRVNVSEDFGLVDTAALQVRDASLEYAQSRSQDVESLQQSAVEVGQLFKRLAHLVSEQSDKVHGLEERLDESLDAMERGEKALTRVNENAGSNVILSMQIAAVLIMALIAFLLFGG
jgi:uncharacterized phage infection (PIP) family protein YhgE